MWSKLQEVFDELETEYGISYSRQGSYEIDEELPESFFTFWNKSSEFENYYNNRPSSCNWDWNVFFYTKNPAEIYEGLNKFIKKAEEKGFIVEDAGKDIQTDEPNYFGRYTTVTFIEILK